MKGHLETSQTSKMEPFVEIVNEWKLLTIFRRSFILVAWLRSKYASFVNLSFSETSNDLDMSSPRLFSSGEKKNCATFLNNH